MPNQDSKKSCEFFAPKVFIRTFGCQMNTRDSEVMVGLLKRDGHIIVDSEKDADIIIFNTCSVRQHAEDKVWSEIGRIAKRSQQSTVHSPPPKKRETRDEGRGTNKRNTPACQSDDPEAGRQYSCLPMAGELNTKPIIGLIGCMAKNYGQAIFEKAPAVNFVVGPSDIHKIPKIVQELIRRQQTTVNRPQSTVDSQRQKTAVDRGPSTMDAGNLFEMKIWETDGQARPDEIYHTGFYEDKKRAYVVISEGCSNYCSYCVVPYVRGELHNRDYKAILKEIEMAVSGGIASITLLGQNVNAYTYRGKGQGARGKEREEKVNFIDLIKMVNEIKGLKEFTFITSHPKDTSVELFKVMAGLEKLKKVLHLPLQSGSDKILKLMNRGYTKEDYLNLIGAYRQTVPKGSLSTDIIVGFPTEGDEDFLETYELMKRVKFNSAYIFKYSPRPNTEAWKLPDDVRKEEKEKRHKVLLDYQKELHHARVKGQGSRGGFASLRTVLCLVSCVIFCSQSFAMLDIFDRPKDIDKERKAARVIEQEARLLDYPRECLLKGNYEEAFNSCKRLFKHPAAQKYKAEILYLTGLSTLKVGHFLEARSYFNDVILTGGANEALKRDAYIGIADAYFLEERLDKAFEAYNQVLRGYPDNPFGATIYYRLAEISYKIDHPKEGKDYLNKIQREFPLSFEARLSDDILNDECNTPTIQMGNDESYSIQVGCYNEKDNADKICEELVKKGFDARILESENGQRPRFRVKVGRFASRDEAEAVEAKLKRGGYPTKICP